MNHKPRNITPPTFSLDIGITRRDVACFSIALALHSLLLLWKGGAFTLPNQQPGVSLGDMIVEVGYLSEIPGGGAPGTTPVPGRGGTPGFLAKVKSFFQKPAEMPQQDGSNGLAMGVGTTKIDANTPGWNATAESLSNKQFSGTPQFGNRGSGAQIDITKGESSVASVPTSKGNFQVEGQPALQEKSFRMASKETPFQVAKPSAFDSLANVNAIPVDVGEKTSGSVKVSGSDSVGPALKSKELNSGGIGSAASFKGAAVGNGGSSQSGQGLLGSLAMGSGGNGGGIPVAGGSGTGTAGTGPASGGGQATSGTSYGTGEGTGAGGGGGTGYGSYGSGSGTRSWGAGSGFGGASPMDKLTRNKVTVEPEQSQSNLSRSGDKDFFITGALAGRPIKTKNKPPYEGFDGRVALRFSVDWSGYVLDGIVLVLSSGNPTFDQKVISILKSWVFAPLSTDRTNEIQEGIITFIFKGV